MLKCSVTLPINIIVCVRAVAFVRDLQSVAHLVGEG